MYKFLFWLSLPLILLVSSQSIYSQGNNLTLPTNTFKANINNYLFSSIDSGNYQLVSYLLIKGADPNCYNSLDLTPLMVASMNRDTNITILLLKKGARINDKNLRGENALQWAIIGKQVAQSKLLIDYKSETNIVDENGITPLFYALGYSAYDLTNYLNEDYCKVSPTDTSYTTTKKLLEILVNSGVNINQVNDFDCTPLLFATFQNDIELVKILCKLGANPNKPTQDGITPLIYATQDGYYGIVEQLIENGAEVNRKLSDGNTALFAAVRANNDSIAELLIQNNAEINIRNNYSLSPLHYAAGYGYPLMTDLLLYYGAKVDATDSMGNTPLMTSVYAGAYKTTELLINAGSDVNKSDLQGNTPLMIAAQFNDTTLINKLFKAGALIDKVNNKENNALGFALKNNSADAFRMLIDLGASIDNSSFKKNYYQQAYESESYEISALLKNKGLQTRIKPNIGSINIYTGFSTSNYDFMVDLGGGIYEPVTKMMINLGYKYRPFSSRVLEFRNSSFYQLWEKRYTFYLSLQHLIVLRRDSHKGKIGFIPGVSNELSWSYYRGLDKGSVQKWYIVPSLGLFYQRNLFSVIGKWEIADYNKQVNSFNRFSLQFIISIPSTRNLVKNKKIEWLN